MSEKWSEDAGVEQAITELRGVIQKATTVEKGSSKFVSAVGSVVAGAFYDLEGNCYYYKQSKNCLATRSTTWQGQYSITREVQAIKGSEPVISRVTKGRRRIKNFGRREFIGSSTNPVSAGEIAEFTNVLRMHLVGEHATKRIVEGPED